MYVALLQRTAGATLEDGTCLSEQFCPLFVRWLRTPQLTRDVVLIAFFALATTLVQEALTAGQGDIATAVTAALLNR
jgi:hypothetical protein